MVGCQARGLIQFLSDKSPAILVRLKVLLLEGGGEEKGKNKGSLKYFSREFSEMVQLQMKPQRRMLREE